METKRIHRERRREMGFDVLEIGLRMRKLMTISIRTCCRSVRNHPFLVGMMFFLILLYRSFPFVFSLLISASPILVCTAVLLGTLLSFGQPNIPEIDKEEKKTHEIVALKAGVSRDAIVVDRDESFTVERYMGKSGDTVEQANEEASSGESEVGKVEKDDCVDDNAPLIVENSRQNQCEKRVIEEVEGEFLDLEFEHKIETREKLDNESRYGDGEVVRFQYSFIPKVEDESFEVKNDKSQKEFIDSHTADHLDSSPDLSWKQGEDDDGGDDDDDEDDELSDSGSDGAESSSPDASMADIIPMLDELHPLLDSEAPQPAHLSHDDSDAASERSQKCNDGNAESDEDTENQEEEEEEEEEEGEDDEEEEVQEDKEDGNKSAIIWTEDDQKNLMDLGTSELERNQRLENLIARRRARKNLRLTAEKNLIDLESADLPFNIAPISIARRNPFDLPYDSYDNMGLPPIPGSAPSILLLRRNPFDLPYGPNEEKPDLMGDSFQQEFMMFHQKDTFFRRHESFSVGTSGLGVPKQEKQDIKWRPYFVPERLASEGTSYPSFQRQSSEVSESKVSSAPETESVCSTADQEDKKPIEHGISQETELIFRAEHGSQSSEDVDSVEIEHVENRDVDHDEVEIKMGDLENHQEMVTSLTETGCIASPVEFNRSESHLSTETVEKDSNRSSLSSLSEVDEEIFDVKEDEGSTRLEPRGDLIEESGISMQSSLEESNFNFTSGVVDNNQIEEPVYDSSPPAAEKYFSFSSNSSDLQVELSGMSSPPVPVQTNASFADVESEVLNESMEKVTPGIEEMREGSLHAVEEIELKSREVTEITEHDVIKSGSSGVDRNSDDTKGCLVPESMVEHVSVDSSSSSSDTQSVKDDMIYKEESFQHELDQVHPSSFDTEIHVGIDQDVDENLDSTTSSYQYMPSEDLTFSAVQEQQPSLVVEQVSMVHPNLSSSKTEYVEEQLIDKEETLQVEQDQVLSSSSNANIHDGVHQVVDEKLVSMGSSYRAVPSEDKSLSHLEKQLSSSEISMTEPSFKDHEEPLESSPIVAKSINEVSITNHVNVLEAHNLEDKVTPNLFPFALDLSSIPSEDPEDKLPTCKDLKGKIIEGTENVEQNRVVENFNFSVEAFESDTAEGVVNEEADEIKEIDEELLLELDAVGDFSIKEMGSNWSDIEKHLAADGENLLVPLSEEEIEKPVVVESLHACREFGSSCKDPNLAGTNIVLPVLEARSFEDIDLAFKQLHEGVNVEQLILPSSIDDRQVVAESEDQVKADLDLQIVEARSLEDIHMALMQVSENNSNKLPKPLDFKEKSVELGANEVGSSKEIESSSEESHIQGTSTCAAANPNHEVGETSEDPNLIKNVKNAKLEANEVGSSEEIESSSEESCVQGTSTCAAENSNHEVVETFKDPNLIEKAKSHKSSSGSSSSDSD